MLTMQPRYQLKNHIRGTPVEIARGFVGQEDLGLRDQRPGQGEALLLAAGEFT